MPQCAFVEATLPQKCMPQTRFLLAGGPRPQFVAAQMCQKTSRFLSPAAPDLRITHFTFGLGCASPRERYNRGSAPALPQRPLPLRHLTWGAGIQNLSGMLCRERLSLKSTAYSSSAQLCRRAQRGRCSRAYTCAAARWRSPSRRGAAAGEP